MRCILALAALTALAGCPSPEDTDAATPDDTDTDGPETECAERLDVEVIVYNDRLWYVEDADVTWSAAGQHGACESVDYDRWICDTPGDGPVDITVSHPQYTSVDQTVAVGESGCRTGEEVVDVTLYANATPFDESRMYYIQRYADAYECEHSWEVHGTGCYYTAAFCSDGYSAIMITDIANFGVYDLDGDSLTNVAFGVLDIPTETSWSVTSATTLEDWEGTEWTLDTEERFALEDCPKG